MHLAITEIKRLIKEASEDLYKNSARFNLLMDDIKYWHNLYCSLVTDSSIQEQIPLLEQQITQFNENHHIEELSSALNVLVDNLYEKVSIMRLNYPKDYGQDWFLSRMKALGYSYTHESDVIKGHCYGIAHMGVQAFLANDITTFNQRIASIRSIPIEDYQNDFALLKQERNAMLQQGLLDKAKEIDQKITDILAFFDGVSVLQNAFGNNYSELFEDKYPVQNASRVMSAVRSLALDEIDNSPFRSQSVSGAYNRNELVQYIILLKENLGIQSFSLVVMSSDHAINLNYDHINQHWLLIDANQLPGQTYIHPDLIADAVLDAFTLNNNKREGLVVLTEIYTTTKNAPQLKDNLSLLDHVPAWRSIHEVSKAKLEKHYPPDPLNQLHYALFYGQNIQLIKQVIDIAPELLKSVTDAYLLSVFPEKIAKLVLLAKQLEGALAINFFQRAYLGASQGQRDELIALIADSIPEWLTSPTRLSQNLSWMEDQHRLVIFNAALSNLIERINSSVEFRDAIEYLPREQKNIVFDSVNLRLFGWINSVSEFCDAIKYLTPEQKNIVFDGVNLRLFGWINSVSEFRDAIRYLPPKQIIIVFEGVNLRLFDWINSLNELNIALDYLTEEQKIIVFDAIKLRLFDWINSVNEFHHAIQYLPPDQRLIVFDAVKARLSKWIISPAEFRGVIEYLSPEQQIIVLNGVLTTSDFVLIWGHIRGHKLDDLLFDCLMNNFPKWITTKGDLVHLNYKLQDNPIKQNIFYEKMSNSVAQVFVNEIDSLSSLRSLALSEEQNDAIILSINGRLSACVSKLYILVEALQRVSSKVKTIVLETNKDLLSVLIQDLYELLDLQNKLFPDNFGLVLTAMKGHLPSLIKNARDLARLPKDLSLDMFAFVLDAIKDKLPLLLMPIGFSLEQLLKQLSSEKRSLVFEHMKHNLPQFSALVKASGREKLIEFYEGWCMEHEDVKSMPSVTKPGV